MAKTTKDTFYEGKSLGLNINKMVESTTPNVDKWSHVVATAIPSQVLYKITREYHSGVEDPQKYAKVVQASLEKMIAELTQLQQEVKDPAALEALISQMVTSTFRG
jgi:hypothetical protein